MFLFILLIFFSSLSKPVLAASFETDFFKQKLEFCSGNQKSYSEIIQNLKSADGALRQEALCVLASSNFAKQMLPNFTIAFERDSLLEVQEMAIVAMAELGESKVLFFFLKKLRDEAFLKEKLQSVLTTNPTVAYSFLETLSYGISHLIDKTNMKALTQNLNSELSPVRWATLKTLDLIIQKKEVTILLTNAELQNIENQIMFLIRTDLASNVCGTGLKVLSEIGGQSVSSFLEEMLSDKVFSSCVWMKTKKIDLLELLESPVLPTLPEIEISKIKIWLGYWYEEFFIKNNSLTREMNQEREEVLKRIIRIRTTK